MLEVRLDVQGGVENVRVVSGHPFVVTAVIERVSTWRFKPSRGILTGELTLCYKNGWDIKCKDQKQIQEKS